MKRVKDQREREIWRNTEGEGDKGENQFTYRLLPDDKREQCH